MKLDIEEENSLLKKRISVLESEIAFLRTHPSIMQGIKGETLIAKLTGGSISTYAESHDVKIGDSIKIEVKFSKLNTPNRVASTKRWNWSKPLGWMDKGKDFSFLLLIGEKDERFLDQYLDDAPYVFFLIPYSKVSEVMTSGTSIGGNVQIISNLRKAKSTAAVALKSCIVGETVIKDLMQDAETP